MIKNKLKLGYLVVLTLAMALGMGGVANAANLTWTANYTVDLSSPDINLTIVSGSKASSLIVGTGTVQVIVASGDTFTITSADRDFDFSGDTTSIVSSVCTDGVATATVQGGSDGETVTITPSGSSCAVSGGGGGGGGGGSSSSDTENEDATEPDDSEIPPVNKPISEMTIAELQSEIARITALINQLIAAGGGEEAPSPEVCSVAFNTDLAYGMVNNSEVKRMQEFMINKGHLAAGYNTGKYATLTANAVGAYQTSKGISPVPNSFGPLTRAAANADCGL